MKFEYKTIVLPFKTRFFSPSPPDVAAALNDHAQQGWRLVHASSTIGAGGSTVNMIAILEREAA